MKLIITMILSTCFIAATVAYTLDASCDEHQANMELAMRSAASMAEAAVVQMMNSNVNSQWKSAIDLIFKDKSGDRLEAIGTVKDKQMAGGPLNSNEVIFSCNPDRWVDYADPDTGAKKIGTVWNPEHKVQYEDGKTVMETCKIDCTTLFGSLAKAIPQKECLIGFTVQEYEKTDEQTFLLVDNKRVPAGPAVITICPWYLKLIKSKGSHVITDEWIVKAAKSGDKAVNAIKYALRKKPIDKLSQHFLDVTILHELTHTSFGGDTGDEEDGDNGKGYGWKAVTTLRSTYNADSYAYAGLVARMLNANPPYTVDKDGKLKTF
ncbi:hypothetical protein EJ08DRAFT_703534 [Tothia fuscella]|uniref:Lysine-specific metallo-endopeptidase domain-containing protein n=1 Tax=Tothia fuscella TaxID=1048955 RepID=A0A9P4TSP5_9PEZI|nr:hypothetical protein EJ08DRAFT_703534 [Tothia fuscella]